MKEELQFLKKASKQQIIKKIIDEENDRIKITYLKENKKKFLLIKRLNIFFLYKNPFL